MSDALAEQALIENRQDLHRYLLRRLTDPDDAAEALNELCLTAWRRRDKMPEAPHDARLWLYGIAANINRNQRRTRARRSALVRRLMSDPTAHSRGTDQDAGLQHIYDAIETLPNDLGELVRLRHWEGLTLAEIATVLDIPASTARTRYAAARRRLRHALSANTSPSTDDPPAKRDHPAPTALSTRFSL